MILPDMGRRVIMSNLSNSTLPKNAFDNTVTLLKDNVNTSDKEDRVRDSILKSLNKNDKVKLSSNKDVGYDKELSHIMSVISNTISDRRLSEGEVFTIKSFMSAIRGLKNSGNQKSAYIIAKNALTYVSGIAFQYTDMAQTLKKALNSPKPEVQVDISDTAKLYKAFTSEHISLERNDDDSFMDKGSLFNKSI